MHYIIGALLIFIAVSSVMIGVCWLDHRGFNFKEAIKFSLCMWAFLLGVSLLFCLILFGAKLLGA